MKSVLRAACAVCMAATLAACGLSPARTSTPQQPTNLPGGGSSSEPPPATPTETPPPIVRVSSGDTALFEGNYDLALQQYQTAADTTSDPNIRVAALWGVARSQYENAQYDSALATLEQLLAEFPDSSYAAPAHFLEGQSFFASQHFSEAADAYQSYLSQRPGFVDSFVQELRGDALSKLGDYSGAISAYTSAQAAPHLDDAQALQIKIAQSNDQAGNTDVALAMYDDIATNTTNDYTRAQMDYLVGKAYLGLNRTEEAYARFKHAVENYPLSYYSYLGLVELIGANIGVNDLDRGLTDYYAGVPDKALESLDRYIANNPGDDGTAHYYRAVCLDELQQYPEALQAYTAFIQAYPSHPKWAEAWDEKSTIQWFNLNQYPEGAQTLLDFVKAAPTSGEAPGALMTAARILERDGRFDQAADVWTRVADEYPADQQAATAMVFAGLMKYRQDDYRAALPLFERSVVVATAPEDQARAYLWIGKTQEKLGSRQDTQNAWQLAQSTDPNGYYSERAADLLMGRQPFAPIANTNLDIDLPAERRAADSWMRLTFKLPEDADLSGLDVLAADPRLIRGREFWNLGLYDQARLEFEDLRQAVSSDAVLSYRLANFLIDLGIYRSGIQAIRQVLSLAGMQDQPSTMLAPPYFNHVRYGIYFRDLILPAAQENGFDPLFLFSVVRQESLFEGFVSSTAGARGLMQIVPATGAGIANDLGWPPYFEPDMLYRPNVSIILGAHYLASNRTLLGGDLYAALAAYNGGPASAVEWKKLSHDDPDAFLESVRAQETRDYIRSIYEIYSVYRRLYAGGA